MPWPQLAAFALAVTPMMLTPGVSATLVVQRVVNEGPRGGLHIAAGTCCGLAVHALTAAVGLARAGVAVGGCLFCPQGPRRALPPPARPDAVALAGRRPPLPIRSARSPTRWCLPASAAGQRPQSAGGLGLPDATAAVHRAQRRRLDDDAGLRLPPHRHADDLAVVVDGACLSRWATSTRTRYATTCRAPGRRCPDLRRRPKRARRSALTGR